MRSTLPRIRRVVPFAMFLLFSTVGCGGGLYPVKGQVTLDDGTPVTKGIVVFESKDEKPVMARGEIQPDGSYQLSTNRPGDGVPAGTYRVLITPPPHIDVEAPKVKPVFDERYIAFATSGLAFEVKAQSNEIPIRLSRPGKSRK